MGESMNQRGFRDATWKSYCWTWFCTLVLVSTTRAQLPAYRLDRVSPVGVSAGASVDVEVSGAEIDEVKTMLFDHPCLSAVPLKPRQFRVSAAPDAPEGTYDARLVGRFGVSNPRLFAVTRDVRDELEKEPNNFLHEAQVVSLNVAINGMSDGNNQDSFRFSARKGQRILLDCQATKLDSEMDAVIAVTTVTGQPVASNADYFGRDPFIDLSVPADGEYIVQVYDLSYRGGYPYRLLITDRPHVENLTPRVQEAGKTMDLVALGRNLPGAAVSRWKLDDVPLQETRVRVTAPPLNQAMGAFVFLEHPTDHAVLPTACTCTLDGFQVRLPISSIRPVTLMASATSVTVEQEPNNSPEQPQTVSLPLTLSGHFDPARDGDWFRFEAPTDGSYSMEVYCERLGGRADPYLLLLDENNNRQEFDDYGHRINAFDGHLRDPSANVGLQAKKTYRVLVQDRYGRGGARYQYVLVIRKAVPNFHAASIHSDNPGPGGTNVWRGGAAYLDLIFHRREGHNAPITVTAEGLPPGLQAAPITIDNDTRGTFTLWSDSQAPEWQGSIRLVATSTQDNVTHRHEVRPYTRVWNNGSSSRPMRAQPVALCEKAPYSLKLVPEKVTVESGQKVDVKLVITRYLPEFKEKLRVIPLGFPGNFQLPDMEIPSDKNEWPVSIQVQPGTRPGIQSLVVLGQGQVPYNKDPNAKDRPNRLVAMPSQPVTLTIVPPKPK